MYKHIKDTLRKHQMLCKGDRVLVCVSGGPDSVFLLHALDKLKKEFSVKLAVANLDHRVRGAVSKRDSDFVKRLASGLGLRFFHEELKPRARFNKKKSREENLREARYAFFKRASKALGANVIATGHTLDDNAETILMRIVKGTSLKGLAGIPPVRFLGKTRIVRPLVEIEKRSLLDFLKKEGIAYRLDHTNLDEAFLRNRVRKRLLPYLSRYNPRIKFALVNMAESLRDDLELMEKRAADLSKGLIKGDKRAVSISLKDLVVQPKSLQRKILKDALAKSGANIKRLTFNHWRDMRDFLKFKRKGQSIDLPGDIRISRTHESIILKRRNNLKGLQKGLH